nr:BrnT family toxin [Pantoea agglomerans]
MKITFDPNKSETNNTKHGYSLAEAENLDWDNMVVTEDDRYDYDETRYIGLTYGIAYLGNKIFSVCFTVTDDFECYRIISLRLATKQEIRKYAET